MVGVWVCCGCSSTVEPQPSKLMVWVRFPSPAPSLGGIKGLVSLDSSFKSLAHVAQLVEHTLGKGEVSSSNLLMGSTLILYGVRVTRVVYQ